MADRLRKEAIAHVQLTGISRESKEGRDCPKGKKVSRGKDGGVFTCKDTEPHGGKRKEKN